MSEIDDKIIDDIIAGKSAFYNNEIDKIDNEANIVETSIYIDSINHLFSPIYSILYFLGCIFDLYQTESIVLVCIYFAYQLTVVIGFAKSIAIGIVIAIGILFAPKRPKGYGTLKHLRRNNQRIFRANERIYNLCINNKLIK